ncbi:hypothetical protein ACFLUV_05810, partial [Elusimicrobiota bacterium]
VDIAAAGSPWADILEDRGNKAYRLDMVYQKGVNGVNIGADAGNTNLPGDFADVLSAQCAYECFIGDSDIRFVKEASRILKTNGRLGIVPLYIDNTYYVATSPYCNQGEVNIEDEAVRVWRDDNSIIPFSRHYSPEAFKSRIYLNIPDNLKAEVLFFKNLPEVIKYYKGQKIYCYFMLIAKRT